MNETKTSVKLLVTVTFLLMTAANLLADTLPISVQALRQIAGIFAGPFAPAEYTFAIWGLIYILLIGYVLYVLGFLKGMSSAAVGLMNTTGIFFSLSSIANAMRIISWRSGRTALALLLDAVILICLLMITAAISKASLSRRDRLFISFPMSLYFGWATFEAIQSAANLLRGMAWNGIPEHILTAAALIAGAVICMAVMLRQKDTVYGLAFIWAYIGIIVRHILESWGELPMAAGAAGLSVISFMIAELYLLRALSRDNRAATARMALKQKAFRH